MGQLAPKVSFFSSQLNLLTLDETVNQVVSSIAERRRLNHTALNVAKLVQMETDINLRHSVNGSDLVLADGQGIVWGARLLGHPVPERVAGIDLMMRLLAEAEKHSLRPYLLGARQGVLDRMTVRLFEMFPNLRLAGSHHGYFWDDVEVMVDTIAASQADMLFVAISSPHKEKFLATYGDRLNVPFQMGVGGSFDVVAGLVSRAPKWMQSVGLEWLYRLIQEPRRMWRRYLGTNLRFAAMLAAKKLGISGRQGSA